MPAQEPQLDIILLDTHSLTSIAVLDTSKYPTNFNVQSPTLEVTAPGFSSVGLTFEPSSIQVYKSTHLGVVCEWCDEIDLPDGIWTFKYSIYPANKYYVEKTFVKVDRIQAKLDEAYVLLDLSDCDEKVSKADRKLLSDVHLYIEGAVAAGNKCVNKTFLSFYKKATDLLNTYINSKSCATI